MWLQWACDNPRHRWDMHGVLTTLRARDVCFHAQNYSIFSWFYKTNKQLFVEIYEVRRMVLMYSYTENKCCWDEQAYVVTFDFVAYFEYIIIFRKMPIFLDQNEIGCFSFAWRFWLFLIMQRKHMQNIIIYLQDIQQ